MPADSDSLVVLYTGETQGNLVACRCPDHPWGGLDRRVGFLRDARASHRAAATLVLDTGGFLPTGEVPLRDHPSAARRLTALLLRAFLRADVDAIALDPGESGFLAKLAPDELQSLGRRTLDAGAAAPVLWYDWGGRSVGVLALSSGASDSLAAAISEPVRDHADVLILLARADAVDGRRLARLSRADLVLLSRAARPPRPLREGMSWLVGCGGQGREVGEVVLR
ncbi:MAG: hypothetical protein KC729_19735, partial [Candidatus Eisenbacteria bacterium]|nr:hypothetical protein [Candidatus Eisenbacteria bacterium]